MSFPRASVDGAAFRNNLAVVRRLAPRSRVMAVVKADGYGHGLLPVARALAAADALGVARIGEGLILRDGGIRNSIVLLEGVAAPLDLAAAAQGNCEIVVHSPEQLAMLEERGAQHRFTVWLKLNTGMNRLGFRLEDFSAAYQRLQRCQAVAEIRAMTHLAAAEERGNAATRRQIDSFGEAIAGLSLQRSIANSAGVIAWPDAQVEWVRPGLMLYGISPLPQTAAADLGLRPAMTLATQLIAIRKVPAGEAVGYNGIWRATRDSVIGIAAIGYGDGYPRAMRGGAPVLVNGRIASVVGRVSMDMIAIDLTDFDAVNVADPVILWGEGLPAEQVAPYADTLGYELVCRVTARVAMQWTS